LKWFLIFFGDDGEILALVALIPQSTSITNFWNLESGSKKTGIKPALTKLF